MCYVVKHHWNKHFILFVTVFKMMYFFKEWCRSKGGYLAELNNKEENEQIQHLASIRHQVSMVFLYLLSSENLSIADYPILIVN